MAVVADSGTVSVLFADVVGSTTLMRSMGDEAFEDLRSRLVLSWTHLIERHHGVMVKTLGDGLMATFGSAADALAAVVALQQHSGAHPPVRLRAGLSAGDVLWDGDDCHGTPVVEASRLCAAASPGAILCSDVVVALVRGRRSQFDLVPAGELELKGLDEPVVTYEVRWEPVVSPPDEPRPLPAPLVTQIARPFVGRDHSTMLVLEGLTRADGRCAVLVAGEPGIGKTRLMAAVASQRHGDGAAVLLGRCVEDLMVPFGPWVEALTPLMADPAAAPAVERHRSTLARLLPGLAAAHTGPPEGDQASERHRVALAIDDVLTAVSTSAPVVVVLEDLHWADEASLAVLNHLMRDGAPGQIAVLGTYRDTDVSRHTPLSATLATLRRSDRFRRVALDGLDRDGLASLVTELAGQEADDALVTALAHQTQGNPFFVTEVLRHLAEAGIYVRQGGRWEATTTLENIGLPEGVRDVVGRRLSRLPDSVTAALQVGAVMGPEFDVDVVQAVVSDLDALDAVELAAAARLVDEHPTVPGRFVFAHALVRQTLLEELSAARRTRLHWRIGVALRERFPRRLDEISFHLTEGALAGDPATAVDAALAAGAAARDRFAGEQALQHYERAGAVLDVAELDDAERRWRTLTGQAWSVGVSLSSSRMLELNLAAMALAEQQQWHDRVLEAALQCAMYNELTVQPHERLLPIFEQALERAEEPGDVARLHIARSVLLFAAMDLAGARDAALAALEVATTPDTIPEALEAHFALIYATNSGWDLSDDIARADEIDRLAVGTGPVQVLAMRTRENYRILPRLLLALRRGQRDEYLHWRALADEHFVAGNRFQFGIWDIALGLADGDLAAVERACDALETHFPDYATAAITVRSGRGEAAVWRGDPRGVELFRANPPAFGPVAPTVSISVDRLALMLQAAGVDAPVDPGLEDAVAASLDHVLHAGPSTAAAWALPSIAELSARLHRPEWAAAIVALLERRRGEYICGFTCTRLTSADLARAQALLALGRHDEAVHAASEAISLDERFRAGALACRSRLWLAHILTDRNGPGDHDLADSLYARVTDEALAMDFTTLAEEAARARR
jgi:class 3 adenylate cyclase/tetratricopeptide (TPR) repeat protein